MPLKICWMACSQTGQVRNKSRPPQLHHSTSIPRSMSTRGGVPPVMHAVYSPQVDKTWCRRRLPVQVIANSRQCKCRIDAVDHHSRLFAAGICEGRSEAVYTPPVPEGSALHGSVLTRWRQQRCEPGYYCQGGVRCVGCAGFHCLPTASDFHEAKAIVSCSDPWVTGMPLKCELTLRFYCDLPAWTALRDDGQRRMRYMLPV